MVSAFALDNGGNVWKQAALKNRQLTAPALLGGALAVGDLDGYVHFLSRSDGSLMGACRWAAERSSRRRRPRRKAC